MASAPPVPPESIVLGNFAGIRNTVSLERLKPEELAAAVNVDIDDAGQLRRRRGYRRVDTSNWHSLQKLGDITLGVRDGLLGSVAESLVFTAIVPVGPGRLCYARVADTAYFSSPAIAGKIVSGQYRPWGTPGAGQWVSPVMRPTETLGAISGRLLGAPPNAAALAAYRGRIYLAQGPALWATELYLYDLVDKTKNFIQFEDDITMLAAVDDGIYVGTTTNLYFLSGTFAEGLKQSTVMGVGVIPGSLTSVPYVKVDPRARGGNPTPEGQGPVFMTAAGVVVGMPGGTVYNLTQDHVVFPVAVRAAAMYREDQGTNSYVAVTDSAGGPSANARIGDYVDAQIVRASQGG